MKTTFNNLLQTRENILKILEDNAGKEHIIPKGFNNSLYWNAAHCVVTQQLLCYKLSGNKIIIDDELVDLYKKGTKPLDTLPNIIEIGKVKDLLATSIEQMEKDYNEGLLKDYNAYPTSYGITLKTISDAILFNSIHEALHLGYMMAMVKNL
jgi:hypothetical protein|tara:strand:- start:831 stop:1286 length:456 start_codon:yes stop_codon:yes gene_type:complete